MVVGCTMRFDEKADQDDESNYGIPFDTPVVIFQDMKFTVKDYRVVAVAIHLTETYEYGGDQYREEWNITHAYETFTKDNIYLPDVNDYTVVDSIYDL